MNWSVVAKITVVDSEVLSPPESVVVIVITAELWA